jgi:predicted amidohydrolase YtcJ
MMRIMRFAAGLLFCYALLGADADLILYHGKIVTLDGRSSTASAIAMKGGRITRIGSDAEVRKAEGSSRTQQIDLGGKMVLPGLIDAHVHPLGAGLSEYRGELPPLNSYAAVQNYIRMKAKTTPKGKWIVVPRTFPTRLAEMRMPTRDVLDVDADHPVLFDASYVWIVNSLGLKMCGIDRNTPNPPGGVIVKDAKGEPTGILRHAESLVKGVSTAETFTEAEKLDALEKMLHRYPTIGLTTIGDRAVVDEDVKLYRQLKASGKLPIRSVLTWRMPTNAPTEELVRTIREKPWVTNQGDEWLKFGAFKVTLDGGMTIGTAYQRQPYGGIAPQLYGISDSHDRGQLFVPPDKLLAIMRAARDKGWAMTAHSQGGGAVDTLLETFEKLNAEKPIAPSRSHWMHASFQSPEAIARAKKIGILADVQPAWLYFDGPALEKVFGHEGMRNFFPLRQYLNAGIILAGGSDHMIGFPADKAVNPYNPFLGMWTAVTRKMHDGRVLYPEERLTRDEALRMYTTGPAYMQFSEKDKGTLESGKLADMVVIDRDYFTCPEDDIRNIKPVTTILNGKIVYEAHDAASGKTR